MSAKHMEIFEKFSAHSHQKLSEDGYRWSSVGKATQRHRIHTTKLNKVSASLSIYTITDLASATTTLQDVHIALARDEALQLASGCIHRHKVSMMGFFSMGFDIEDQQ